MSKKTKAPRQWIKGTVDWFDDSSGEGFIQDDFTGEWYFVHHSAIDSDNNKWKTLQKFQKVKFKIALDPTRKQVEKVVKL